MTNPQRLPAPRLFVVQRDHDVTGISGEGVVAEGVLFSDGWVVTHWLDRPPMNEPKTDVWHNPGTRPVLKIHSHGGATRLVWASENAAAVLAADATAVQALYEGFHAAICVREPDNPVCQLVAPQFRDALRAGLLRAQHLGEDW